MGNVLQGPRSGAVGRQLERLFRHGTAIGLSESELIERFVHGRDETAFEVLLERHGPMVWAFAANGCATRMMWTTRFRPRSWS